MAADLSVAAMTESLIGARDLARLLTEPVCRSFGLLPVGLRDGVVTVAVTDAGDDLAAELARNLLGEDVELCAWSQAQLDRAIGAVFGDRPGGAARDARGVPAGGPATTNGADQATGNGSNGAHGNGANGLATTVEMLAVLRERFGLRYVDSAGDVSEADVATAPPEPVDSLIAANHSVVVSTTPAAVNANALGWRHRCAHWIRGCCESCLRAMFWHSPDLDVPERETAELREVAPETADVEDPRETLSSAIREAVDGLTRRVAAPEPVRGSGWVLLPALTIELTQRVERAVTGTAAVRRSEAQVERTAHDADADAETLITAEAEAGRILDSAAAHSRWMLADAEAQVDKLLADGRSEHDAILAHAEAGAKAMLARASAELDRGVGRIASLVDEIADIAGAAAERTAAGAMDAVQAGRFIAAVGTATERALAHVDVADAAADSHPDPDPPR